MTLFGENYNSAEFMLGLITRAEHCGWAPLHITLQYIKIALCKRIIIQDTGTRQACLIS